MEYLVHARRLGFDCLPTTGYIFVWYHTLPHYCGFRIRRVRSLPSHHHGTLDLHPQHETQNIDRNNTAARIKIVQATSKQTARRWRHHPTCTYDSLVSRESPSCRQPNKEMSFEWNLSDAEDEEDGWNGVAPPAGPGFAATATRTNHYQSLHDVESDGGEDNGEQNDDESRRLHSESWQPSSCDSPSQGWGNNTAEHHAPNDWPVHPATASFDDDESSGGEVEWEDADNDNDNGGNDNDNYNNDEDDRKPAARGEGTGQTGATSAVTRDATGLALVPVTIDLGDPTKEGGEDAAAATVHPKPHGQRRRNKVRRRLPLDPQSQALVRDLSRTHLLALVAHVVHLSRVAVDETLRAVLLSLVPDGLVTVATVNDTAAASSSSHMEGTDGQCGPYNSHPRLDDVQELVNWFARWQVQRFERTTANRRAGAPALQRSHDNRTRRSSSAKRQHPPASPSQPSLIHRESWTGIPIHAVRLTKVAAYWSDPDPQLEEVETGMVVSPTERLALFVALVRSLGWRVRLVQAANPLPPPSSSHQGSVDVHHPLFAVHCHNLIRQLVLGGPVRAGKISKGTSPPATKAARGIRGTRVVTPDEMPAAFAHPSHLPDPTLLWAEILCATSSNPKNGTTKGAAAVVAPSHRRWIHVDPLNRLVNRPDLVESLSYAHCHPSPPSKAPKVSGGGGRRGGVGCARRQRIQALSPPPPLLNGKKSATRKPPPAVAYVVAVEHASPELRRITDVTPRYARSWTECLRARGGGGSARPRRGAAPHDNNTNNDWWSTTLLRINGGPGSKTPNTPPTAITAAPKASKEMPGCGKSAKDAIEVDDETQSDRSSHHAFKEEAPLSTQFGVSTHPLHDAQEAQELRQSSKSNEVMPTSKVAFAQHPLYVIPSVMGQAEVLEPGAKKRICGLFKGECVYPRDCVSTARPANKWLYLGRRVRDDEVGKPVKRVKARKRPTGKQFRPLASYGVGAGNDGSLEQRELEIAQGSVPISEPDGLQDLYGIWQTDPWEPPRVGPEDPLPAHPTHKTIELALLNPGLAHIDRRGMAPVAKQLGIPYAPCLVGFEGHGGARTPTIRGIVVHEHYAPLLCDAGAEVAHIAVQQEHEERQARVTRRWKKLMRGLMIKDRIEREYGDDTKGSTRNG